MGSENQMRELTQIQYVILLAFFGTLKYIDVM